MVEGISHITFVVKNLQKTAELLETVFDAKKVYDSGDKTFSISKELFYLIGDQWIVIMENEETVNRTYHHVAFKIKAQDLSDRSCRYPRVRYAGPGVHGILQRWSHFPW